MVEIWKDIKCYEGYYQVSNLGNVKNSRTGRLIKPHKKCGYLQLLLCKNGKIKHHLVHRLVAEAFIQNPDNLPIVNHVDENKINNCVDNLEWCTQKYNINYGTSLQKRTISKSKPVEQYTIDGQFITEYQSAAEAERKIGIGNSHINACCQGKRKSAGGFIWKFKSPNI